jgi:hypothetical protein
MLGLLHRAGMYLHHRVVEAGRARDEHEVAVDDGAAVAELLLEARSR